MFSCTEIWNLDYKRSIYLMRKLHLISILVKQELRLHLALNMLRRDMDAKVYAF